MASFIVEGGHILKGTITPQGAKNEALQVLTASLLTCEPITYHNVPEIRDVLNLLEILKGLGVEVKQEVPGTYTLRSPEELNLAFTETEAYRRLVSSLRGSVMLVGALLARVGRAVLPRVGGDRIGRRRLDTHIYALKRLGVVVEYDWARQEFEFAAPKKPQTDYILLPEPSVTGTANTLLACARLPHTVTIYNAACEPYIQQLCALLEQMGARIEGAGTNRITITGNPELKGATHRLLPDMIEVGSFIGMAVLTGSEITIKNAGVKHLGQIPDVFRRLGATLHIEGDDIYIPPHGIYSIEPNADGSVPVIYDAPWPGFTPDLISVAIVMSTQAKGTVLIHQKMFESRLFFVDNLIEMGAHIILCDPHRVAVVGLARSHPLRGIRMSSPDIRAGIALLIAALAAQGTSIIHNIEQIERGYQHIDKRLAALGAHIKREE